MDNMISHSLKFVTEKHRIKKDGSAALYLRVTINRQSKKIPVKISWPVNQWDEAKQVCRPRHKADKECDDINLILRDTLARATEIFVQYRLRRLGLSIDTFLKEFNSNFNRDNFLVYYEQKMKNRLRDGEISSGSFRIHLTTLNHLKTWKKEILFSELTDKSAIEFEAWLKRKTGCQSKNARWCQHKNFKTYLNSAKRDNINFVNPYDFFKAKCEMGRFIPLTQYEFLEFWHYYNGIEIQGTDREVVRAFIFTCVTGMRHSDVRRVSLDWIDGDFFDFVPKKTQRFGTRVRLPVTKEALDLIADELDEVGQEPMFRRVSEQKQNKYISQIAERLGIKKNVCFQVGRETFATLYMEQDGKLEVLAAFMGHTSTKMSEKYIKIRDQRKRQESLRISAFFRAQ
jgi:integrase/recombinase XerD